ncbi:uncharacterized protein isoform X2 [Rhodnius prolixus]|uniref:uncharacterized protein isoform X2 n=1 Tax=Rhodnius prolixus TaxID=13249 RepID=UPI003D18BE06
MHCCFMFSPLRQMDSSKSEVAPSVADYLEKEKLCQELCKTITESVECTNNVPITSLNIQSSALLPELNSDQDIEEILQQISDYLVTHFGENSQCTEDGISEGLSVEEILKEAECIVRASTPYFERKLNSCSSDPLPLVKNIKHLSSVKKIIQKNYLSKTNNKSKDKDVLEPECIAQEKPTELHDSMVNRAQNLEGNEFNLNKNNNTPKVDEVKAPTKNEINDVNSGLNSSFNNIMEEEKQYEIVQNELTLSDLQTVPPNATYTVTKEGIKLCRSMTDINIHKQEEHQNTIADLNKQIAALTTKVAEYEKMEANLKRTENLATMERQRVQLLQDEIRSQEDLIESYQNENQRLSNDLITAKEIWKETEEQLVEKVRKLDQQLKLITVKNSKDYEELHNKYRKAQDTIKKLDNEIKIIKEEKSLLEKTNEELTVDVTRLNCEVEEYKKELQEWGKTEREKLAVLESNAVIQSKLSQANTEVTRKQTEIIRLNGEIGRLRGELEKIRLGSVVNHSTDNSCTITQLQAALAMERENCRDVSNERDSLIKEIAELKRQLKEMESIIIKRSKSGICFPPLSDYQLNSHSKNIPNDIITDKKNKDLERQMVESKSELNVTKQMLKEQQVKYENEIFELEQQIKKLQKENNSLKHLLEDQPSKSRRVTAAINSAKEDAHLLATIRGLKMELNAREKDIIRLNKELDDTKKTNKRLQKERERSLNPGNKLRASIPVSIGKDIEKSVSRPGSEVSVCSSKDYNPVLYEEEQETLIFLRTENRSLREEIKKLEQDLISLHNKRIQDLSDLQEQHEVEVARLVRDHAAKHASSTVAHLQSQLYTQQMVIHHLKDQIKELETRLQEVSMLKAERDHLETTLIEANKKIARLHDLASPESVQYSGLLEKLEFLERRHEVREQKLQSIVRDLIAKQGQGGTCSSNCRDKLLNKNREICYYRAEMDKILDTLSEFRWN